MIEIGTGLTAIDILSRALPGTKSDMKMDSELRECVKFALQNALLTQGVDASELPSAILTKIPPGAATDAFGNLRQDPEGERAAAGAMTTLMGASAMVDDAQVDQARLLAEFGPAFLGAVRDRAARADSSLFHKFVVDHLSGVRPASHVDPDEVIFKNVSNLWTLPIAPAPQTRPEVDEITALLGSHSSVTISGGPGAGKSTIAALIAGSPHAETRDLVWWMTATTRDGLGSSCDALLAELDLPPSDDAVAQVRRLLATHGGWFLVLDDVSDDRIVSEVVPNGAPVGSVLVTTRDPALTSVGTSLALGDADDETMRSIARTLLPLSTSEQDVIALAEACAGSPLAIATIARYVAATGTSAERIGTRLATAPSQVLSHEIGAHYPESFAGVVEDAVCSINHPHTLLTLIATAALGGSPLPRDVLGKIEPRVAGDGLDTHVARLSALGLIGFSPSALTCHALIAGLVRTTKADTIGEVAARIVEACAGIAHAGEWGRLRELADIATVAADLVPADRRDPSPHLDLALALTTAGMHRTALDQVAWAHDSVYYDAPRLAKVLVIEANALLSSGDPHGAQRKAKHAAEVADKAGDSALVASARVTLAWCHDHLGERSEALTQAEAAVQVLPGPSDLRALREHFAIPDLPDVKQLKRYRALAENETIEAPSQAMYLGIASRVAVRMGRFHDAVTLATKALEIDRSLFGNHNIYVARDLNDLGMALVEAGCLDEAEDRLREAIEIYENEIPDHVSSVLPRTHLGRLLTARAWSRMVDQPPDRVLLAEAREVLAPALKRQEAVTKNTVEYSSALVAFADALAPSDGDRAIGLLERAVEVDREAFGDHHIETATDTMKLMEQHLARASFDDALRVFSLVKPGIPSLENAYPKVAAELLSLQVLAVVGSPRSGPVARAEARSVVSRLARLQNDARLDQSTQEIINLAFAESGKL